MFNLREFAENNKIRTAFEYKELICPTRSRRFSKDHLFDGFKDCCGIHVERPTKRHLNSLLQKLMALGATKHQTGDTEANLKCPIDKIPQIARFLKISKAKNKAPENKAPQKATFGN